VNFRNKSWLTHITEGGGNKKGDEITFVPLWIKVLNPFTAVAFQL